MRLFWSSLVTILAFFAGLGAFAIIIILLFAWSDGKWWGFALVLLFIAVLAAAATAWSSA